MDFHCRMDAAGSLQECFSQCAECKWAQRFSEMRFDKAFHLGAGDIRLTIGEQEAILKDVARTLSQKLLGKIMANNIKVVQGCLEWQCSERDRGERCPNCPREYEIEV